MRRGTTPTHTFTTDIDLSEADVIFVTYEQGDTIVIEKTIDDLTVTSESISVELTQEETLAFNESGSVKIQIRARFADGTAVASNIMKVSALAIIKEGVI